jgi:hypothetical protein
MNLERWVTNRAGSGAVLLSVEEFPDREAWSELARRGDGLITFDAPGQPPALPQNIAQTGDGYDD